MNSVDEFTQMLANVSQQLATDEGKAWMQSILDDSVAALPQDGALPDVTGDIEFAFPVEFVHTSGRVLQAYVPVGRQGGVYTLRNPETQAESMAHCIARSFEVPANQDGNTWLFMRDGRMVTVIQPAQGEDGQTVGQAVSIHINGETLV